MIKETKISSGSTTCSKCRIQTKISLPHSKVEDVLFIKSIEFIRESLLQKKNYA
jgi:hypothetical protein